MFSSARLQCLRTGGGSGGELLARKESEGTVEAVMGEKWGLGLEQREDGDWKREDDAIVERESR